LRAGRAERLLREDEQCVRYVLREMPPAEIASFNRLLLGPIRLVEL